MPTNPVQGDVHVNTPLSNISVAHVQRAEAFVAGRAFPGVPVAKQGDVYFTYPRGEFNRNMMEKRAAGAESAGAGYNVSTDSYFAEPWALHKDIPDQVRANADSVLSMDRDTTTFLTQQALISREVEWTSSFFASSIWTTDVTPGTLWSATGSTPIEDIRVGIKTILQSTGFKPNTLVLGYDVFNVLIDHGDIIDRVKYGAQPGRPSQADLPELSSLLKIPNILVMEGIQNSAKEGQTASHAFIGGKHALLCYAAPTPGIMTPSAGYTFNWTGLMGASGDGMRMKKFRLEREASDRLEIEQAYVQKVVSADLGYFFESVVS